VDEALKYDRDGIDIHFLNKRQKSKTVKVWWIVTPRVN
jgi:hypothetical protein